MRDGASTEVDGIRVSSRVAAIPPSATLAVGERAAAEIAKGRDIVPLGPGEPTWTVMELRAVREESARLQENLAIWRYGPTAGLMMLRELLAEIFSARWGRKISPTQVVLTPGVKGALDLLVQCFGDQGVAYAQKAWPNYRDLAAVHGYPTRIIPRSAADGFMIDGDRLKNALWNFNGAWVRASPDNPTGAVDSQEIVDSQAAQVAEGVVKVVFEDAIYDELVYEDGLSYAPCLAANPDPDVHGKVFHTAGSAKLHGIPGNRNGFVIAPTEKLARVISKLQGIISTHPANPSIVNAVAAYRHGAEFGTAQRARCKAGRDLMVSLAKDIPGFLPPVIPQGALYLYQPLSLKLDSDSVVERLLLDEEGGVAVVPGRPFDETDPNYIRLSFGVEEETIRKGMARVRTIMTKLMNG